MPAVAEERINSPRILVGADAGAEKRYAISDTTDEHEAYDALAAAAPVLYDLFGNGLLFLPRGELRVEPDPAGGADVPGSATMPGMLRGRRRRWRPA